MSKNGGTVVIAIDNSQFTSAVVEEGSRLAGLAGMKPVLVSVVRKSVPPTLPTDLQTIMAKDEEKEFSDLHETLMKQYFPGGNAESEIIHGDPGEEILELADERHAKLIVMGTRGRGLIRGSLLGSVAARVVREAECPVLVVKTKKA